MGAYTPRTQNPNHSCFPQNLSLFFVLELSQQPRNPRTPQAGTLTGAPHLSVSAAPHFSFKPISLMLPLKYLWNPASVVTTTALARSLQGACFVGEVCFVGAEIWVPIPGPWLASCLCDPGDGSSFLGAFLVYRKGAGISSCGLSWVTGTCPGPLLPPRHGSASSQPLQAVLGTAISP